MIIDNSGTGIASLGRDEDRFVAHVAPGERVIPPVISVDTQARLSREMMAAGLDPDEYIVGPHMSINPITGQPEFGWLKKTFKSVKKVAKKVAPVAMFIPGVGQALGAVGGSLLGKVGLGNVASGIGSLASKVGLSGVGNAITAGAGGGLGSALQFGKQAITSGIGSLFTPKGMMGQAMQGGMMPPQMQGGYMPQQQQYYGGGFMPTFGYSPGYQFPSSPSGYDPITGSGQSKLGLIEDFIKGNNRSGYDPRTGAGQSRIGMIEDFIKGGASGIKDAFTTDEGKLSTLGAGGLAALVGKIAYDQAKSRSGGLAETPAVTMDQLGRYQLSKALGTGGTREEFGLAPAPKALKFAQGGAVMIEELDMRDGGESAGPGTGTSDDIPAMLSDGEFVMTAKATRGAGAFDVNKTKSGIELVKGGSASREEGVKNMRELMNIFEAI